MYYGSMEYEVNVRKQEGNKMSIRKIYIFEGQVRSGKSTYAKKIKRKIEKIYLETKIKIIHPLSYNRFFHYFLRFSRYISGGGERYKNLIRSDTVDRLIRLCFHRMARDIKRYRYSEEEYILIFDRFLFSYYFNYMQYRDYYESRHFKDSIMKFYLLFRYLKNIPVESVYIKSRQESITDLIDIYRHSEKLVAASRTITRDRFLDILIFKNFIDKNFIEKA